MSLVREEFLEEVFLAEGFEDKPYQDTLGVWTFGHGLTFITEDESENIVEHRLKELEIRLVLTHPWLEERPIEVLEVLIEMCYQLGWRGCHSFQNTWRLIEAEKYEEAAVEMKSSSAFPGQPSRWYRQTPNRVDRLAKKLVEGGRNVL